MSSLTTIMDALADSVLAVVDGDPMIQVYGRMVVNPTPPTIDVFPAGPFRDSSGTAGFDDLGGGYLFTVRARVSTVDNEAGQDMLAAFMDDEDPYSITAALDANPTLDGHAYDTSVVDVSGFELFPDPAGGAYIGARWTVLVLKANS